MQGFESWMLQPEWGNRYTSVLQRLAQNGILYKKSIIMSTAGDLKNYNIFTKHEEEKFIWLYFSLFFLFFFGVYFVF